MLWIIQDKGTNLTLSLSQVCGHHVISRLDDKRKVGLVQVYLGADKNTVAYIYAKQAVGKVYNDLKNLAPLIIYIRQTSFTSSYARLTIRIGCIVTEPSNPASPTTQR